jgi:ligand-binding SRPBCC domain-containing protein
MRPDPALIRCIDVIRHLHRQQFVAGDPLRIWEFFATPRNLDRLTSPHLRFRIMGDVAPRMYAGQMIEYHVGIVPGVWTRWLTEITQVREGEFFVDEQRLGPYRLWHHEHHFVPSAGGVTMMDHVTYDPGWGPCGALVHALWIRRKLDRVFDFRAKQISTIFPGSKPPTA